MSLRGRLLIGVLLLVAAGLSTADAVTYAALNTFLTGRIDQQLRQAADPTAHFLQQAQPTSQQPGRDQPLPPGTYAALLSGGSITSQVTFGFTAAQRSARPQLPTPLPQPQGRGTVTTVAGTTDAATSYRLGVFTPRGVPGTLLVAIPLTEVVSTLHRLLLLELGVGAAVLLLLGALAAWVIGLGLRPLDHMAATAGAIAAGDLQQRVPATSRTEVGRLGMALNTMLARIEEAFAARTSSEDRLRRFVGDASHELRTPVATIRGYAELFRRGASSRPEDLAMSMRRIEEEAARMGVLVDDLLLLARLDSGRPLEQGDVDLAALAADAAADARAMDPARAITLATAAPVRVHGDEQRLRQVLSNLLRNALVHTPPGTPVEVCVEQLGPEAVASVVDHGPGVSPELSAKIFERFFRADPARGREHGSSGLGLSIVASVVTAHGGRIDVGPTPGGGATFCLHLPMG
ncbi:MAG TPA: HAMP domain-containing sensor histidine kinase [Chloroflexota bacterium]|nr:HAMP domain-containing sensor histidine kinase [Chloroflexota bacterium]